MRNGAFFRLQHDVMVVWYVSVWFKIYTKNHHNQRGVRVGIHEWRRYSFGMPTISLIMWKSFSSNRTQLFSLQIELEICWE